MFTLTTTPPPPGPFAVFIRSIKEKNEVRGEFYFRHVNHSLVCDECFELREEGDCVHQLGNIPPWKSVMAIHKTASIAPAHQRNIVLQEMFGVAQDVETQYIPSHLVDRLVSGDVCDFHDKPDALYVAIDPASHESSHMGMVAIVCGGPAISIMALASVSAQRCAVVDVQTIVVAFVRKAIRATGKGNSLPVVFIIECNGSSVYAASILRAARGAAHPSPVMNPFTRENFSTEITPNIGPWTTHMNKFAMIEETLGSLIERRITVHKNCDTVGREVIDKRVKPTRVCDSIELLGTELKRVADHGNKISGKMGGLDDDLAMALFLAVYWLVPIYVMLWLDGWLVDTAFLFCSRSKVVKMKSISSQIQYYRPV